MTRKQREQERLGAFTVGEQVLLRHVDGRCMKATVLDLAVRFGYAEALVEFFDNRTRYEMHRGGKRAGSHGRRVREWNRIERITKEA